MQRDSMAPDDEVVMHVEDILVGMRSGQPQPAAAIEAFVQGVVDGTVSRPQAAAWLAWAFARGLNHDETVVLTRAMTHTGDTLAWPAGPTVIDKHSTGGVGDKVSLILAPLWMALGLRVPMLSGRGLGHTGGTLDKLEAIPGFRTDLPVARLRQILEEVGGFMAGQTAQLAPADRVLYALRNEIQGVESIPLIVGSILSKKLAEGIDRLVLDVKAGSGAFMKDLTQARALATALVEVAEANGVRCTALITEMSRPLGQAVGNALEVAEAVACLRGGGPDDLRTLTLALADHPDAEAALDDGRAYARFKQLVAAHGGDVSALDDPTRLLGGGTATHVVTADTAGFVATVDAMAAGRAAFVLGAGRRRAEDPVDMGVGLTVHVAPGDRVVAGQPMVTLHHRQGRALDDAIGLLTAGLSVVDHPVTPAPLIHDTLGA